MLVTLSSLHYLTVNVLYVHLLLEYKPHLDISLPSEHDPKIMASSKLSENWGQLDYGVLTPYTGDEYASDF